MSESDELPKREQPTILNELEVRCRVDPVELERWNEWVSEHHYLKNGHRVSPLNVAYPRRTCPVSWSDSTT